MKSEVTSEHIVKTSDIKLTDKYAPVIIPTLYRYEHLKKCLDSLMKCTHADKTDVYIGLDYPAKESHWDGYYKISEYLDTLVLCHSFKSLNVIKRNRNYGVGNNGNFFHLCKEIYSFSDCLIASEDDNVFAPAFLDYINKGLLQYKNDPSVFAICGYRHFFKFRYCPTDTVFFENYNFSAWGYGMWKDRFLKMMTLSSEWLKEQGVIKSSYKIAKKYGWERTLDYLHRLNIPEKDFIPIDIVLTLYMILSNKYVVVPVVSLVRNIGIDGSGENFRSIPLSCRDNYSRQAIFISTEYNIIKEGIDYFDENNKIFKKNSISKVTFGQFLISIFKSATKRCLEFLKKMK